MESTTSLTQGKIFSPLIRFALPVLLALLLQTMYGAVDLLVVGQFATAADISAVATGGEIMRTATMVVTGLAMGLTVLVGREIGAGNRENAGKIIGSGICLFLAVAVVMSVGMALAAPLLAEMMQAPPEALERTTQYITICSVGAVFIVAYNLVGSIFRGIGDSKMPLITVAIACVLNVGGDLLLVAGFGMGADGAAVATVLAQAVSVGLSLGMIRRRDLPFSFARGYLRFRGDLIRKIVRLGIPIALQDLLVSVSFLVILAIVNSLGLIASSGVGISEKICGFIMLVPAAYMQAMSAFVAQNLGAGKPERANKALLYGILSSLSVGVVMAYFNYFHGDVLAGIFAREPDVIAAAAEYLRAYAIDTLLVSFLFCFIGYYNGCGNTLFTMIQGIAGAFGVRIPVSWYMSRLRPVSLFRIGLATPASTVVQILLCFGFFFLRRRRRLTGVGKLDKMSPATQQHGKDETR